MWNPMSLSHLSYEIKYITIPITKFIISVIEYLVSAYHVPGNVLNVREKL